MFPFSPLALSLASRLLEGARSSGGATVGANLGSAPDDGFMVGRPGYGITLELEGATLEDVARWVTDTRRLISAADYLGSWVSEGTLYLDVSERFSDRGVALIVASQRGELAIWDVANGDEITV